MNKFAKWFQNVKIGGMKRDIYQKLIQWKLSSRRKPLILKGARQTGKTHILKEFAKNEYKNISYFNFEEDNQLNKFFHQKLDPKILIEQLSIYQKKPITPGRDLIIFDEIQASNQALNSLKYFNEKANEYHIAAAGSLLGITLSTPKSFPVGKVNFLELYPLTFFEFLDAIGEAQYRAYIEGIVDLEPLPEPFHEELIKLLRKYYFIGGMPEAVKHFAETNDLFEVRSIQKEILNSYILDFAKHAPPAEYPKLNLIWDNIPSQLAKENKKFIFSAIKKSSRAREYENAIFWLNGASLISMVFETKVGEPPLKGYINRNNFKIYAADVGLLGAMANVPEEALINGDQFFNQYRGAFVENYVAQQLRATLDMELYYWKSASGKAELDFVIELQNRIFPLEIKAGINTKSKSLVSFDARFQPAILVRSNLLNLKKDGKICNIPLYAIQQLPRLLQTATGAD